MWTPAIRSARSVAASIALTVSSRSVTTPLRIPVEGASPTPMISARRGRRRRRRHTSWSCRCRARRSISPRATTVAVYFHYGHYILWVRPQIPTRIYGNSTTGVSGRAQVDRAQLPALRRRRADRFDQRDLRRQIPVVAEEQRSRRACRRASRPPKRSRRTSRTGTCARDRPGVGQQPRRRRASVSVAPGRRPDRLAGVDERQPRRRRSPVCSTRAVASIVTVPPRRAARSRSASRSGDVDRDRRLRELRAMDAGASRRTAIASMRRCGSRRVSSSQRFASGSTRARREHGVARHRLPGGTFASTARTRNCGALTNASADARARATRRARRRSSSARTRTASDGCAAAPRARSRSRRARTVRSPRRRRRARRRRRPRRRARSNSGGAEPIATPMPAASSSGRSFHESPTANVSAERRAVVRGDERERFAFVDGRVRAPRRNRRGCASRTRASPSSGLQRREMFARDGPDRRPARS